MQLRRARASLVLGIQDNIFKKEISLAKKFNKDSTFTTMWFLVYALGSML